jgi:hypothetical protein
VHYHITFEEPCQVVDDTPVYERCVFDLPFLSERIFCQILAQRSYILIQGKKSTTPPSQMSVEAEDEQELTL